MAETTMSKKQRRVRFADLPTEDNLHKAGWSSLEQLLPRKVEVVDELKNLETVKTKCHRVNKETFLVHLNTSTTMAQAVCSMVKAAYPTVRFDRLFELQNSSTTNSQVLATEMGKVTLLVRPDEVGELPDIDEQYLYKGRVGPSMPGLDEDCIIPFRLQAQGPPLPPEGETRKRAHVKSDFSDYMLHMYGKAQTDTFLRKAAETGDRLQNRLSAIQNPLTDCSGAANHTVLQTSDNVTRVLLRDVKYIGSHRPWKWKKFFSAPNAELLRLSPGEKVDFILFAIKGNGQTHAKFAPANLNPRHAYKVELPKNPSSQIRSVCEQGVFSPHHHEELTVVNGLACTGCQHCVSLGVEVTVNIGEAIINVHSDYIQPQGLVAWGIQKCKSYYSDDSW